MIIMSGSFMDVLRKKEPVVTREIRKSEERRKTPIEKLERLMERYSSLPGTNPNEKIGSQKIKQEIEDFLKVYESRINEITSLVRGLTTKSGKLTPKRMSKAFGGRLLPVFTEMGDIDPKTNKRELLMRDYNGMKANELYLEIVGAIPGLSSLGGDLGRGRYSKLVNFISRLRDAQDGISNNLARSISNTVKKYIRERNYDLNDFKKIQDDLEDAFTEVSIEISDYKDLEKDIGLDASALYSKRTRMKYVEREDNTFEEASEDTDEKDLKIYGEVQEQYRMFMNDLYESLTFLDSAHKYVTNVIGAYRHNFGLGERMTGLAEGQGIKITDEIEEEEEDTLSEDAGLVREAESTLEMMEKLVEDFDGHEFTLPDGESRIKVNILGEGENLITSRKEA